MAYKELVKNFEKIRSYMREFYVYGFKNRNEYDKKSARTYDNEKRRIESWLGDYMKFTQTAEGKKVFLSVDNRLTVHNPFFKAWKARSFTDGDITLHFIIFDILNTPEIRLSVKEIIDIMETDYLCCFSEPLSFDEKTVRNKLNEYISEGIITSEKQGRQLVYSRTEMTDVSGIADALDFFSEISPCGAVGSFILDKLEKTASLFSFKHHYITGTLDSDVLAELFHAMREKCSVRVVNFSRHGKKEKELCIVPIKILISTQNGRQNLIGYDLSNKSFCSFRVDYLSDVRLSDVCEDFDRLREKFTSIEKNMWGVTCRNSKRELEHVEFVVFVGEDEQFIVRRLEREKRCGTVEKLDDFHYRFSADVFDTGEMLPWIRTFITRITQLDFSNRTLENRFRSDLDEMYRIYGIDGGDEQ